MRAGRMVAGLIISLIAAVTLATGPAAAVVPASVSAAKPSWSSGFVKSSGNSFKTASGSKATYTATVFVYRTTTSAISCTPASGCTGTGLAQLSKSSWSVSVSASSTFSVAAVSTNCAAQTASPKQTRYYWTYLKVADASGAVKATLSGSVSGTYC